MFKKYSMRYYNYILFSLVVAIMLIGILVINSVNSVYTVKQSIGFGISIVFMIIISFIDYHFILKFAYPLYIFSTVLLALVLLAGTSVNNARRWFTLAGIRFQPSELAKILMIIFMAFFLSKLIEEEKVNSIRGIFGFLFFWAIPILLIYKEPDLSTTLCLTLVLFTLLYISGLSYKIIGIALLILIPTFSIFIWYIQKPDQKLLYQHQVTRIMSFIYPSEYEDETMQQENSVMAIGSGQLMGKGLRKKGDTNTSDTNLISEQQTDFIFSAVGESFGFFGSVIIIGIILLIVLQCIRAGRHARDDAGSLLAYGIGCLIGYQSFINIGVATKLLPNTGIPLPFVSYGLTSLVSLSIGIGIVLNVSLQKKRY